MELEQALNLFSQAGLISEEARDNLAEALAELLQSKPTTVRQYLTEGTNLPSADIDRFFRAFSQLKGMSSPNTLPHAVRVFGSINLSISYDVAAGPLLAVRGDERDTLLAIISALDDLLNPARAAKIPDSMKRKLREIHRSLTLLLSPSAEIDQSTLGRLNTLLLEFIQMGQMDWWKGEKPLNARVASIFSRGLVALNRVGEQARENKTPVIPASGKRRKPAGTSAKPKPKVKVLARSDFRNMPWANGKGVTTQMVLYPHDGAFPDNFIYRLSQAKVAESGPFSKLPGVDRILILLSGNGIDLKHVGKELIHGLSLMSFDPHLFAGDDETIGTLVDGPIVDFNIMTRRGHAEADAQVLKVNSSKTNYPVNSEAHYFLYAAQGGFTASFSGSRKKYSVSEGELLAAHELPSAEERTMHLMADGESAMIIAVEMRLSETAPITAQAPSASSSQSNSSETDVRIETAMPRGVGKMQDDGGPARNFVADPATQDDGREPASPLFSIVGAKEATAVSGIDFQIIGAVATNNERSDRPSDPPQTESDRPSLPEFGLVAPTGMARSILTTSLFKVVR